MAGFRRPESVLVLVVADLSTTLLLRRLAPFSFWQSITGSLDPGEQPREAALRELREETGLQDLSVEGPVAERTFTIDPRWRSRYAPGVTKNVEHEFQLHVAAPVSIKLDPQEHNAYQWVELDVAVNRVWSWTNKAALEALKTAS